MPRIGVIADDLTGGTTTGVLLARSQAKTIVYFNTQAAVDEKENRGLDAVVISSNSRPLAPALAQATVSDATKAMKKMGVEYFTKRIDTTLRGGIGYEIDAMMEQIGNDVVAVVVPAMPQSHRIVVGGYSVIDGVALINTPVAHDVRTPVLENYVPDLLGAQTKRKVGLVQLQAVLKGADAIKEKLAEVRAQGCGVIVVDAITIEDVEEIAKACVALQWNVLAVDPGPFTAKLAYVRKLIGEEHANIPAGPAVENKTVLIIAGSATPVTAKQMEVLCGDDRNVRVPVDPVALINGGKEAEDAIYAAVDEGCKLLEQDKQPRSILFETALHGVLLDLAREEKQRGLQDGDAANRINAGLGAICSRIMQREGREKIAGIYATGGDTMVNVCASLGVSSLVVKDYVIAQTDIGRLVGAYDGLPIVGKGGLTGNNGTAIDVVDRLMLEASEA